MSMSVIVKICGLSTPDALDVALDAGADMVGFVFFPPSPRHVGRDTAAMLGRRVAGRALKVALTVDADDSLFDTLVDVLKPDMLQLHGKETPARVEALKKRFGLPVMKAIAVETRRRSCRDDGLRRGCGPAAVRCPRAAGCDATRRARQAFRLDAAGPRRSRLPFMLSGGLDAGNVGEALRITAAPGRRRLVRRRTRAGRKRP